MRFAVVIVPSASKSTATTRRLSPVGELLADRLSEPDAGWQVELIEAKSRLAERLSQLLDEQSRDRGPVLVCVSGRVALDDEGEPTLSLKGGGLPFRELRSLLAAATDDAMIVVDASHEDDPDDPAASASIVGAIRDAVDPKESGIGLVVGAHPLDDQRGPSPFVRSFLAGLDATASLLKRDRQVFASAAYEAMRKDSERFHGIAAAGHFRGRHEFPLLSQASIVIGGSDSVAPASRSSNRPVPSVRSQPPSLVPPGASQEVEQAWRAGSTASREGKHLDAIEHYKRALLLIPGKAEKTELYFRIGREKEELSSIQEAIHNYDKALGADPLHREAFDHASQLLIRRKDFGRLEQLLRRRMEAQSDPDAKQRELAEIARLWLERASEPAKAIPALTEWAKSGAVEALEKLVAAQSELGRHASANDARKRLAEKLEADPARAARVLAEAARTASTHLPNGGDSVDLARRALELDPGALEALEVVAKQLGTRRRWKELASVYEKLLERIDDDVVIWDLAKKLGMLARDELDDAAHAKRAFSRAASANPEDIELHFWLTELYEAERDYAGAAREMRVAALHAPESTDVFRRALWCFEKTGETDSAWNAACVLDQLGDADINESLLADQHRPEGLIAARGSLNDADWSLLRPERDAALDRLLGLISDAAIALRVAALEKRGGLPKLDETTLQSQKATTTLVRSLAWSARLLGMDAPEVHVLPSVEGDLSPLPTSKPTVAASRALVSGLELADLTFLWGRALSFMHPEHRLVVFYPTLSDVAKLLLAALDVAGGDKAEGDSQKLARGLITRLDDDLREELGEAADALGKKRLRSRVGRYVRSVHAAAGRAGLLACGDVARAATLLARFPWRSELEPGEQLADLRAFSISREYATLREHVGVAVKR